MPPYFKRGDSTPLRFRQEIAVSLTGGETGANKIYEQGIDHLIEKCEYLKYYKET